MTKAYLTIDHLSLKQITSVFSRIHVSTALLFNATPCWEWTGCINAGGYGHATWHRKPIRAHRLMYAWLVAPLPPCTRQRTDVEMDHLCKNRKCCNPAHLELVTKQVNMSRVNWRATKKATQTHCIHGHEYTPENTIWRCQGKARACRTCVRASQKQTYRKLQQNPAWVQSEKERRHVRYLKHEKARQRKQSHS